MHPVLEVFCFVFAVISFTKAQEHGNSGVPVTEPCVLTIVDNTTETQLRTSILLGDLEKAADILSTSNEIFSLAAGLTYTPEQQCFLVPTQNASRDPDVVAFQAVALSAERTGDTDKLSTIIVLSFQVPCECSLFTPTELDQLRSDFKSILDDPDERQSILAFDGTEEEPSPSPQSSEISPDLLNAQLSVGPVTPASPDPPVDVVVSSDDNDDILERSGRRLTKKDVIFQIFSFICARCGPFKGRRSGGVCCSFP